MSDARLHFYDSGGAGSPGAEIRSAEEQCHQVAQHAAEACMKSFSGEDFRSDLAKSQSLHLSLYGIEMPLFRSRSGYRTYQAFQ